MRLRQRSGRREAQRASETCLCITPHKKRYFRNHEKERLRQRSGRREAQRASKTCLLLLLEKGTSKIAKTCACGNALSAAKLTDRQQKGLFMTSHKTLLRKSQKKGACGNALSVAKLKDRQTKDFL